MFNWGASPAHHIRTLSLTALKRVAAQGFARLMQLWSLN